MSCCGSRCRRRLRPAGRAAAYAVVGCLFVVAFTADLVHLFARYVLCMPSRAASLLAMVVAVALTLVCLSSGLHGLWDRLWVGSSSSSSSPTWLSYHSGALLFDAAFQVHYTLESACQLLLRAFLLAVFAVLILVAIVLQALAANPVTAAVLLVAVFVAQNSSNSASSMQQ